MDAATERRYLRIGRQVGERNAAALAAAGLPQPTRREHAAALGVPQRTVYRALKWYAQHAPVTPGGADNARLTLAALDSRYAELQRRIDALQNETGAEIERRLLVLYDAAGRIETARTECVASIEVADRNRGAAAALEPPSWETEVYQDPFAGVSDDTPTGDIRLNLAAAHAAHLEQQRAAERAELLDEWRDLDADAALEVAERAAELLTAANGPTNAALQAMADFEAKCADLLDDAEGWCDTLSNDEDAPTALREAVAALAVPAHLKSRKQATVDRFPSAN